MDHSVNCLRPTDHPCVRSSIQQTWALLGKCSKSHALVEIRV